VKLFIPQDKNPPSSESSKWPKSSE